MHLKPPRASGVKGRIRSAKTSRGRQLDLVVGGFRISKLVTLAHGAHVAVWHRPVEAHVIVIEALQKV